MHQKGASLSVDDVKGPEGPGTETCLDLEMEWALGKGRTQIVRWVERYDIDGRALEEESDR